jgi:ribosome-associated toxin RatA of RatAB toxin-antitoxin module
MHNVTVKREINHDVESVWNVLDDFGTVHKYHPGVKTSSIIGDKQTGMGAKRVCNFYDGSSLKETIIKYTPNQGYSFRLSDFSLPLKSATSHFQLEPLDKDKSLLSVEIEFEPKFGPLGWLMAKLLMRPMLTKALNGLTKGLDDYMTSGQLVGQGGELLAA